MIWTHLREINICKNESRKKNQTNLHVPPMHGEKSHQNSLIATNVAHAVRHLSASKKTGVSDFQKGCPFRTTSLQRMQSFVYIQVIQMHMHSCQPHFRATVAHTHRLKRALGRPILPIFNRFCRFPCWFLSFPFYFLFLFLCYVLFLFLFFISLFWFFLFLNTFLFSTFCSLFMFSFKKIEHFSYKNETYMYMCMKNQLREFIQHVDILYTFIFFLKYTIKFYFIHLNTLIQYVNILKSQRIHLFLLILIC